MPLEHLWATWRSNYVTGVVDSRRVAPGDEADGRTLFERILAAGEDGTSTDRELGIVARGPRCFVLLNRFPYTSGHLMVLPRRPVADLDGLDGEEHDELWSTVRTAVRAQRVGFECDGVNVGLNLGEAAGGSQSDHLHVHCVPRWIGDANFIGIAAETRVLPVGLDEAWDRLRAAWDRPARDDTGSAWEDGGR
ncbi:MAG TPA: HIT domain-containing protein [Microthrixaceae bacterium]|nr:HIT domain-containing protein [Microthrixaceae bacterium]